MRCESARLAVSAGLDAADAPVGQAHLDAHLAGCIRCREWQEAAHSVTRRVRLGSATPDPSAAHRVVEWVRADLRRGQIRRYWLTVARAVVCAGLLQVLATVPLLVLARSQPHGSSRVQLLGLVEAALGAIFFVGALVLLWRVRDGATLELVRTEGASAPESSSVGISEVA